MSCEKRSACWISSFTVVGILMLVTTMYVVINIHMEFNPITIFLALIPNTTFWTWLCVDLWRHNGRPRYIYRWIDPDTGKEVKGIFPDSDTIFIRQKVSGWGGSSMLIIPEPPACNFPSATNWSLDQSSTLSEIVLVDGFGRKTPVASLATAIWLVSKRHSVIDAVERGWSDEARAEQFGKQRDQLIGAFLCLERLVDKERDTFGNSPYGALVRHYTNVVLRYQLEQEIDLTRFVFVDKMNGWQHLADQCVTKFGRR